MPVDTPMIGVENLAMAFGEKVVQKDVGFTVANGSVFAIIGGSGCGKSTLLKHMIGLGVPSAGRILYGDRDINALGDKDRNRLLRRFGVLFQAGALWSSMTVADNIALPLELYSSCSPQAIEDIVAFKLSLVGLEGCGALMPSELSGGMRKRAGLARALALDPEILFLDEPSAGLDPVSSRNLDELIVQLRECLGATIVIVTHELASIFAIADDCVFLDSAAGGVIAHGNPGELRDHSKSAIVRAFLNRGEFDATKLGASSS